MAPDQVLEVRIHCQDVDVETLLRRRPSELEHEDTVAAERRRSLDQKQLRPCHEVPIPLPRWRPYMPRPSDYGRSMANTSFAASPNADPSKYGIGENVPAVVVPRVEGVNTNTSSSWPLMPGTEKPLKVER